MGVAAAFMTLPLLLMPVGCSSNCSKPTLAWQAILPQEEQSLLWVMAAIPCQHIGLRLALQGCHVTVPVLAMWL